jgi:iron(III) transport system permease protein
LFFLISFVLPVGQLAVGSLFKFFGFYGWDLLTLENYRLVYHNHEVWRAFSNTMLLGFGGATATMILGSLVAYIAIRTDWRGRNVLSFLAWLPWLMPGMVLGVGFLWAFAFLPRGIPIYGTIWTLLIAYISLGTPLAVRVMSGTFRQMSKDLEECSRVHGASWWRTVRTIVLALSWPSFAVGWILIFFAIMRELSVSILLYSVGTEVFSVVLLRMWLNGDTGAVSVVGLFMIALVLVFRVIHYLLSRRVRAQM